MPTEPQPVGIDLARVALANAQADARRRPSAPAKKKPAAGQMRRRSSGRDPVSALEAVKQMLIDRGYDVPAAGGQVIGDWAAIAPDLAHQTAAEGFNAETGTLSVRPSTAAYGTQLRLNEQAIVARINEKMGQSLVTSLRILPPRAGTHTAATAQDDRIVQAPPEEPRAAPQGYVEAKKAQLAADRPQPDPLPSAVRRAIDAHSELLRNSRESPERFTDAVAFQEDLTVRASRSGDSRLQAIARARAEKAGRSPAVSVELNRTA